MTVNSHMFFKCCYEIINCTQTFLSHCVNVFTEAIDYPAELFKEER